MSIESFYDGLADDYHLCYVDWPDAVRRQGQVLTQLIRSHADFLHPTILDSACGIGTQILGLALEGYAVRGTDISPKAIDRARREAVRLNLDIDFSIADFRHLDAVLSDTYEVIVCCDNSLPHLIADEDLALAIESMRKQLAPGGLLIVGIRDYDALHDDRPNVTTPQVVDDPAGRSILFQVWDWAESGQTYEATLYVIRQRDAGWETTSHSTLYRALLREELEAFLDQAGFVDIVWHFPDETGHHQPLVTAVAPVGTLQAH